jgi:hypothetical protein
MHPREQPQLDIQCVVHPDTRHEHLQRARALASGQVVLEARANQLEPQARRQGQAEQLNVVAHVSCHGKRFGLVQCGQERGAAQRYQLALRDSIRVLAVAPLNTIIVKA